MESPDRVHRNPDHGPRSYTDQVLKMLKDKALTGEKFRPQDAKEGQSESIASIQGSRRGCRVSFKRGRESESVDGPSSGLHRHAKYAAEQPANRVKPESKGPKRLLKRKTAVDVEILKEEMEDVKKTVASLESLLTERYKKKRVSFAEDLH
ncbi:hypothetical protein N7471_013024 [Penicillium samsonianum]|uniref:uncharacterized protein n=1 Tax=Penicillium samsonianum TaxID=1882272 RepID=UPI002547A25A|nr:uncharacterized protein N7471_013024 [Penicillium samsonianum]KAJ6119073.1 hypothetical protein N7471_013024 [Penicillium samsonianum]